MRSCHLQMKSFIPAFLFCMLFTSFSCLVALSSTSVQCLIEVERVFIFVFLLISGRKLLVFHHEYTIRWFLGTSEGLKQTIVDFFFQFKGKASDFLWW